MIMVVGSTLNQPKTRPKGKKKQPEGTKFAYLSVQEKKNKNLRVTDHN